VPVNPIYISVPILSACTTDAAWTHEEGDNSRYCLVRWHFALKESQLPEPPKTGERIGGVDAPAGSGAKFTYKRSMETLDLEKSVLQSARENEVLQSLTDEIRAELIPTPLGKLRGSTRRQVSDRMKNTFAESFEVESSLRVTEEMSSEIQYDREGEGVAEPMALVRKFQRYRAAMFLTYIDYLTVEYTTSYMGLRKKRQKQPAPHDNLVKLNIPVASIQYWKEYLGVYWEKESAHVNEVPEPYAIEVTPANDIKPGYVAPPSGPSLYRIANAVFPLKWVKRKGPWTTEELMAIEEQEYSARAERRWRFRRA
jgi:hypothetical protein